MVWQGKEVANGQLLHAHNAINSTLEDDDYKSLAQQMEDWGERAILPE